MVNLALRTTVVLTAVVLADLALVTLAAPSLPRGLHDLDSTVPATLPAAVEGACALTLLGAALWGTVVALACLVEGVGARVGRCSGDFVTHSSALRPRLARLAVAAALGTGALSTGALGTAHADPLHGPAATAPERCLAGLPLPDRTAGGRTVGGRTVGGRPARAAPAVHRAPPSPLRVRPGDSLWELASQELGAGAAPAEVAAFTAALYATNRARIGDDPDLLLPGTALRLPAPGARPSPTAPSPQPPAGAPR